MQSRIGIVVLAAGGSTRMGQPKQLLPLGASTILEQTLAAAIGSVCRPVIAVVGASAEQIRPVIGVRIQVVENPDWPEGIHTSIGAGLRALQLCENVDGVVLTNADQPYIKARVFNALVARFRSGGKKIVASSYSGTMGCPALFAAELFPELLALTEGGAKAVIRKYARHALALAWPEGAYDVDTPEEYEFHRKAFAVY